MATAMDELHAAADIFVEKKNALAAASVARDAAAESLRVSTAGKEEADAAYDQADAQCEAALKGLIVAARAAGVDPDNAP